MSDATGHEVGHPPHELERQEPEQEAPATALDFLAQLRGSSLEKIGHAGSTVLSMKPATEEQAQRLTLLHMVADTGLLHGVLPEDPAELDRLLAVCSHACLLVRSDDAEPIDGAPPAPAPSLALLLNQGGGLARADDRELAQLLAAVREELRKRHELTLEPPEGA